MTALVVKAPAKINLGLEVPGKRDDGFHDIVSILAMITLADTITIDLDADGDITTTFDPDSETIDPDDNLVRRAVELFNEQAGLDLRPHIHVVKRIPVAAGLGGASTNAATTLRALNQLAGNPIPSETLGQLAARLGSDVPFFLGSPVSLVTGRGTQLEPLPPVQVWAIILTPAIAIPHKTKALYGALTPRQWSDGSQVHAIADRIRSRQPIIGMALPNAFEAVLERIAPAAKTFRERLDALAVAPHALSGAGPSRYMLFDSESARDAAVTALEPHLHPSVALLPCALGGATP